MTRDPVALWMAQPIVDRFEIEPRRATERVADVYLIAAITVACVNVATVTMSPVAIIEILHVIGAFGVRGMCRSAAAQGPVYLVVQPFGMLHLVMRLAMFHMLMFAVMNVAIAIHVGLAGLVPLSMFRWMMSGAEAVMGLMALYVSMCRRPPPRPRARSLFAHG